MPGNHRWYCVNCDLLLVLIMTSCNLVQPLSQNHLPSAKVSIGIGTFLPKELVASLGDDSTETSYLWNTVLPRRLSSVAGEVGTWLANIDDDNNESRRVSWIAHVIPPSTINLFHRSTCDSEGDQEDRIIYEQEAIYAILQAAVQLLTKEAEKNESSTSTNRIILKFGALDRRLAPHIQTILKEGNIAKQSFSSIYTAQCGMWIYEGEATTSKHTSIKNLPLGVTIQPLSQSNAKHINDRWEYKSNTSLDMIQQMIQLSEEQYGGCVGLFVNNQMVSWVCRYLDGTLGKQSQEAWIC